MDNVKNFVLKESEKLNLIIEKETKSLILISLLKIKNYRYAFTKIKNLQIIINQYIQYGNYRSAYRYIVTTNVYINKILKDKLNAERKITNLITCET